jgi:tetratricopeptide (TPR) repeat protein
MSTRSAGSRVTPATTGHRQHSADTYYAWAVCGCLLAAVWLIYDQTLGHPLLVYDDSAFVTDNPHVTPGLTADGICWAFTEGPFGEWYPLAPLSHMLDCQLFGLNAWGHHLTSVLLHAAASIALFLVWRSMTGELWPSALVAAVFAVHPQHVESVAWVAERRDVLSGLFFVLTLGAWLGYVRHGRSLARYSLAAVLFALGLLAKPMLVTLPPLLLLLDFWPLARFGAATDAPGWTRKIERPGNWRLVLEKLPLVALAVGACVMTMRTHARGHTPLAWSERIGNAAVSGVSYVAGLFYPVDLAAFYPAPAGGPPLWKVAGAIAFLAVVSAAAVIGRRRWPYCFVGWFWYLGMVSPVLGLLQFVAHVKADRYVYLPGIGLSVALAWGAVRFGAVSLERRFALAACAGLAIALLVACAVRQTSFWRDDETLWRHALACTTDNGKAEFGLADALARKGRPDEAIVHFLRAQQHPVDSAPFDNLGVLLAQMGRADEAIVQYRQALAMQPDLYATHVNLGLALLRQKQLDEATEHFDRALEINPLGVEAHCGRAHVLLLDERIDDARAEFEQAIAINPRHVVAHTDLARTLLRQGKIAESIRHCEAALAVDSRFLPAHVNLARALAASGQTDEAAAHYRQVLEIDPNNSVARRNLDNLRQGVP